ncbi:hypothetical protein [Carboxylicivirga linearis]|uniref:Uncharacterized protein n=1 Tax=Carboxylicivirga linearis TaxID=1628157 RepID=A0ABS5JS50_9BACT|nr:hypothetical protein [Carboxylicivirga linearis]MBS2097699.1 hypothetical protein [Carboxylicivirga linearis]
MKLIELTLREELNYDSKCGKRLRIFNSLLIEIAKKELPDSIVEQINDSIRAINTHPSVDKPLDKAIKAHQLKILKLLEKHLKIVPKNHYRNLWLAIGMAIFGIPIGVAFGTVFHQMAFLGIGLPIGLSVGMAIGAGMDKKAQEEGRQLDVELNN